MPSIRSVDLQAAQAGGLADHNCQPAAGGASTQPPIMSSTKATLWFSIVLLFFLQALTLWLESIYKISLTRLAPGPEVLGLVFMLSPLCLLAIPERAQPKLLTVSFAALLVGRAVLPWAEGSLGVLAGGICVGAFLILLSLLLSRPFGSLRGEPGIALGVALLASIGLRAWGASYDISLGRMGAVLGWVLAGLGWWWYRKLPSAPTAANSCLPSEAWRSRYSPTIGLFGSLTVAYLVLSSPEVVEAWLGFANTLGTILCVAALAGAVVLLGKGWEPPPAWLALWNLAFGAALVGGILALRVTFPAAPEASAVLVQPDNPAALILLNVMFLLSPVVLFNVQASWRSLQFTAQARRMAAPVMVGMVLLMGLSVLCILTNVWGYVPPVSLWFRNQFHLPFLVSSILLLCACLSPGGRSATSEPFMPRFDRGLGWFATVLAILAAVGAWHYRPQPVASVGEVPKQLTILTYNLQQGAALGGNRNWENQLAFLKQVNADLIGLQESDTARPSNGQVVAAKFFAAKLGYHYYHGPNTVSGTYGTAILSRFPLRNPRSFFTFSDQDEVGTAVAEIQVGGKTIGFFNSHPSGHRPSRSQAEELVRQLRPYDYAIAVGDFNATTRDASYRILAAHLKDSWAERHPTGVGKLHPQLRPRGATRAHGSSGQIAPGEDTISLPDRIDHIFLSAPFRVVESYYLPAPDSQTDHPAHWAAVTLD
jgi:endonuclease/exonuclease/phosphatase family metal-dependent hydrolase